MGGARRDEGEAAREGRERGGEESSGKAEMRERHERLEGLHRNRAQDTLRSKEEGGSAKFLLLFLLLAAVTALSKPESLTSKAPTPLHVWYYGWLAAICTGMGALPLLVFSKPSGFILGLSNAVAAGMMLSASYSLAYEGLELDDDGLILLDVKISHAFRVSAGVMLGIAFVLVTKQMVETWDQFHFGDITGLQASKIILIVAVMTLHSFAEVSALTVLDALRDGSAEQSL